MFVQVSFINLRCCTSGTLQSDNVSPTFPKNLPHSSLQKDFQHVQNLFIVERKLDFLQILQVIAVKTS